MWQARTSSKLRKKINNMTQKQNPTTNYQPFHMLPKHLKEQAIKKAKFIGYSEQQSQNLYYNNDGKNLLDGVIDKGFKF